MRKRESATASRSDIVDWPTDNVVPEHPHGESPMYRVRADATPEARAACAAHNRHHHGDITRLLALLKQEGFNPRLTSFRLKKGQD